MPIYLKKYHFDSTFKFLILLSNNSSWGYQKGYASSCLEIFLVNHTFFHSSIIDDTSKIWQNAHSAWDWVNHRVLLQKSSMGQHKRVGLNSSLQSLFFISKNNNYEGYYHLDRTNCTNARGTSLAGGYHCQGHQPTTRATRLARDWTCQGH